MTQVLTAKDLAGRAPHPDDWIPEPKQAQFLSLTCREALYGGAAGGGKSDALLVDAIRYVGRGYGDKYNAIIFRRTLQDVKKRLLPRSRQLYTRLGGKFNGSDFVWTFPGGETVWFGYCDNEKDVERYQGVEYQFAGFDELTQFTEYQYKYIGFSRMRSPHGIRIRLRATSNPGGEGHEWVFDRFGPWLNPESPVKAAPGEVLYFVVKSVEGESRVVNLPASQVAEWNAEVVEWNKTASLKTRRAYARGRTFIPANVWDNQYLAADGEYMADLNQLQRVERERLLHGNWLVKPAAKMYFDRTWFDLVDAPPAQAQRIRYWDRASTGETEAQKRKRGSDPDYTVGLLLAKVGSVYYVEDVVRFRKKPADVKKAIKQTAELDGKGVLVGLEQDPGQAGEFEISEYKTYLDGWHVKAYPARVDKVTRAGPVSTQCEAGNVKIVRGAWNKPFLDELEDFPEGGHDDQVDALSGAHNAIGKGVLRSVKDHPIPKPRLSVFGGSGGW